MHGWCPQITRSVVELEAYFELIHQRQIKIQDSYMYANFHVLSRLLIFQVITSVLPSTCLHYFLVGAVVTRDSQKCPEFLRRAFNPKKFRAEVLAADLDRAKERGDGEYEGDRGRHRRSG